jgi:hypothetical protein
MTQLWLVIAPFWATSSAATQQPLSPRPTLHTPDVIAPAVLPYLACLYAERGLPLLRAADGSQVAYDKSSSDCSAARARARQDAAAALQGKPVPGRLAASEFIDEALADMDSYVASLPVGATAHGTVIGIPVTIEDEVEPMYTRYDRCLKTQASGVQVAADTIIAKFKQAMAICASVRNLAVNDAKKALIAKGWDEATRSHAAETTFAKVDESWLALGEQYRQSLLEQMRAPASQQPKEGRKPH